MNDIIPQETPQGKRCNRCEQWLPLTSFTQDRAKKDGLRTICRVCTKTPKPTLPTPPEGYKRCRTCEEIKPATTEYFNATAIYVSADGLAKQCIECRKKYRKAHNADGPKVIMPKEETKWCPRCEKNLPANLDYFSYSKSTSDRLCFRCKKCANANMIRYRLEPGGKEHRQAYRRKNAERDRVYRKTYRQFHKERMNAYGKWYRKTHKQHCSDYGRSYRQSERGRARKRIEYLNRLARKKAITGSHTAAQIAEQLKRQRYRCYYCHCKLEKHSGRHIYHVDHTFPLSRVIGTDIPANDISYLVLTCPTCNLKKANKFPWEFPEGGRLF